MKYVVMTTPRAGGSAKKMRKPSAAPWSWFQSGNHPPALRFTSLLPGSTAVEVSP